MSQGQGGGAQDWHKDVDQFAGDYKKYMSQGQGGGQDWHKYVDQNAGDYKKYMSQGPPASLCRDLGDIRSSRRRRRVVVSSRRLRSRGVIVVVRGVSPPRCVV